MVEAEKLFDALEPATEGQSRLKEALASEKDLVGVFGPTGTGKSLFSIAFGVSNVLQGNYKRFIVARPVIDVASGKEITILSDPSSYRKHAMEYIIDILAPITGEEFIEKLVSDKKLVLIDPHLLRGRTFDESIILLDDVQNTPPESVVEIITRLGRNSKLIVAGDPVFQRDTGAQGAVLAREILLGEESAEVVDLGVKDIVRPGAKRGIRLLLELQVRRRPLNDVEMAIIESAKTHAPDADVITAVYIADLKEKWGITSEHVPDALIVVKETHLGRLIGRGGERITAIEEDVNVRLRSVPLTLDFKEYIRAFHPVAWVHKHVIDADFAGPQLRIVVEKGSLGPMLGQRGAYIKFVDEVFKRLFGIGVYVVEGEERRGRRKRR